MTNPKVEERQAKYFSQEIIDDVTYFLTIFEEEVGAIDVKIEVKTSDHIFQEYTKDPSQDVYTRGHIEHPSQDTYAIYRREVIGTESLESKFETEDFFHAKDYLDDIIKWGY